MLNKSSKYLKVALIITTLSFFTSCEELLSKGFDSDNVKKLRSENNALKIQLDKLQKQIKLAKDENTINSLVISLYDLRHAVEKYALENNGNYPETEDLYALEKEVQPSLPKDFKIDSSFLETIKSTKKGYIFIANFNNKKIVVSNLI
ncbi:MAG: hypothetical protein U0457_08905 [Candidatus Sericytochromatia bacterium]